MKFLKGLFQFILILIILGGIGFLVWNFTNSSGNMTGMNMGNNQNNTSNNNGSMSNMPGMQNNTKDSMSNMPGMQSNTNINNKSISNKEKLSQVLTTINAAVDQITIDPYSKITVPRSVLPQGTSGQQGNTTINIYPNTSNTVTVPTPGGAVPATVQGSPTASVVYNQGKLEQLHNGIFKLSQGLMLLNELNDDLTLQAAAVEPNTYDGYVRRFNTLVQNKTKLSRSLSLINEASYLVNINPYTSSAGYEYDLSQMSQLHSGIFKLAQGMLMGVKLGEDFTAQMAEASNMANNASMNGMNMGNGFSIGSINITIILYVIIAVFIFSFVIALFGAVRAAFRPARVNEK